jgi:PAS domain S-box-containing protein
MVRPATVGDGGIVASIGPAARTSPKRRGALVLVSWSDRGRDGQVRNGRGAAPNRAARGARSKRPVTAHADPAYGTRSARGTVRSVPSPADERRAPDWRSVVEHLDGAVIIVDLDGRVMMANAAALAYAATPPDDILGAVLWELPEVAPMKDDIARRFAAAAAGADVEPIAIELVDRHGATHVVNWHSAFLRDGEGRPTHVLLTGHDVTRQHEAEAALRERDQHYREAFERADTVWWELDLVSGEGVWPEAAAEFYGVGDSAEPPSLELWRSTLHPDDREADAIFTQRMLDERWETFETENRIIHPERGVRWIRTQGRVVYGPDGAPRRLLGIDTDVTGRRRAEERLRQSEADFRTLADSLPQIAWTAKPDGRVDYYNRRWTEFSGIAQAEGEAWGWRPVLHPEDEAATVAAWREAVATGTPYTIQHRVRRHDGSYRWHMSRGLPVKDDAGHVTKWFGTATDVHDQQEASLDLLRRTRQQAAVAELGILALQADDATDVIDAALRRVSDVLAADRCALLRVRRHDDGRDLVLEAAVGFPVECIGTLRVPDGRDSQAGFTLSSPGPVVVADQAGDSRFGGHGMLDHLGVVSSITVVIHGTGDPFGILGAHSTVARAFDEADGAFVQSVANVIAEAMKRQQAASVLEGRVRRLNALHAIDTAITDGTDTATILRTIVEHVREQLEVDAVAVLTYRDDLQTLEHAAGTGFHTDLVRHHVLQLGQGRPGAAALERRIEHVPDARLALDTFVRRELLVVEAFVAYWAVPLVVKGELEGVLELFHRTPLRPDAGWHDFLTTLATQTAIAINNSRLFANLQLSNTKLRHAYDATIEGWARALELKDQQTEGHSRRVTELTVRLAQRMGMRDDDLVHLKRGALLHDIGKMAVPDRILLKEGELSAEEWEVMRGHPTRAYELLAPIEFLRGALAIPYAHHERWDGGGYPRGLAGEQIPLPARIFAVADVYDALTSERPYWLPWTREQALAYVREEAGHHFDPAVARAFVDMMG